jgi:hypothetical protein
MKKIFGLIVVVIILGAAFWFFGNKKTADQENLYNQENQENQESILVSTSTISQTGSFYNIKANYPQFAKADPVFNKKIADLITGKIDTFKKDVKDYQDARNATLLPGEKFSATPTEPFDFIADWAQTQINDKYLSVVITMYYFTGGAHGINEVYAFNYDVAKQKEITISDFLGNSTTSLQKLSQLAEKTVTSQLQSAGMQMDSFLTQMIKDGTKPTADNYKNFNFTADTLTIYFQQYQVAPGSAGPITITLSKELLEQNSIISNYLK